MPDNIIQLKEDLIKHDLKDPVRSSDRVSILVAIGVSSGSREIIGAAEGFKEDKESWRLFFVWLKERGLSDVHARFIFTGISSLLRHVII